MLPSKVEGVRIFTCDWPSDLLQPSDLVQKTEEELARLLFEDIRRRVPATSDQVDRPILFIASCLGGIILMKALVGAGETYHSVRRATRGIVFLATPFRGTSFRKVEAWAKRGLGVPGFDPRPTSQQPARQRDGIDLQGRRTRTQVHSAVSKQRVSLPSLQLLRNGKDESSEQSISLAASLAPPRRTGTIVKNSLFCPATCLL